MRGLQQRKEESFAWVRRGRRVLPTLAVIGLGVCGSIRGLASEVDVIFNDTLTNGTGWVYGPKISFNKENDIPYIRAKDGGQVISPDFGFVVTSVVVALKNTTATEKARKTWFSPVVDGVVQESSPWTQIVQAPAEREDAKIEWPKDAGVRAFSFYSGTGSGNTYFYEARILGIGAAESPVGCQVVVTNGTSVEVAWENGAGAVSNCVEVATVETFPFAADFVTNFTFDAIANEGKSIRNLDAAELGEDLDGWVLRVPTNSVGIVQLGSGTVAGGIVVKPVLSTYEGLSLVVRAGRYVNKEEGNLMPVQWVLNGVTNELARVVIENEMKEYVVGLDGVDAGAAILVRSMVKGDVYEGANRRVWLEAVGFARKVREAYAVTNLVARKFCRGRSRMRVGGLEKRTRYVWTVKAFNEEGQDSVGIGWMAFETTGAPSPATIIRVQ